MVKIIALSGREQLAQHNFRTEVETYWMPLWGDAPETQLTLAEAADVGIIKKVSTLSSIAEKRPDGAWWELVEYDLPENSFIAMSFRVRHGDNLHQQDVLLYVREGAMRQRISIDFLNEATCLSLMTRERQHENFFAETCGDVITQEQGNAVGIKFPDRHFFAEKFVNLYTFKEVSRGSKLKAIVPRPATSINLALSLRGVSDETIVVRDYGGGRAMALDD